MGLDAMIFVFWMLSFKPAFSLSSFTFIKRLFGSSSLSAIRVVSSAYLRLLIFLPGNLDASLCFFQPSISHDVLWISKVIIYSFAYSFPDLETVCCSMSSSYCYFLICIQIPQEAGQVVRFSHLLKSFPQFTVIHTVKGFGKVNKAKIDVFLELSCLFNDPADLGNLVSGSSASSKSSLNIWKYMVRVLWLGEFWALLC